MTAALSLLTSVSLLQGCSADDSPESDPGTDPGTTDDAQADPVDPLSYADFPQPTWDTGVEPPWHFESGRDIADCVEIEVEPGPIADSPCEYAVSLHYTAEDESGTVASYAFFVLFFPNAPDEYDVMDTVRSINNSELDDYVFTSTTALSGAEGEDWGANGRGLTWGPDANHRGQALVLTHLTYTNVSIDTDTNMILQASPAITRIFGHISDLRDQAGN